MAFKKLIFDLVLLMLLGVPLAASTNIDCGGKSFHCLNSTHFMICVDLGAGVSTTVDDFVIPCPPPTVCQGNNRFECEFPAPVTPAPVLRLSDVTNETTLATLPYEEIVTTIFPTNASEMHYSDLKDFNTVGLTKVPEYLPSTEATVNLVGTTSLNNNETILNATESTILAPEVAPNETEIIIGGTPTNAQEISFANYTNAIVNENDQTVPIENTTSIPVLSTISENVLIGLNTSNFVDIPQKDITTLTNESTTSVNNLVSTNTNSSYVTQNINTQNVLKTFSATDRPGTESQTNATENAKVADRLQPSNSTDTTVIPAPLTDIATPISIDLNSTSVYNDVKERSDINSNFTDIINKTLTSNGTVSSTNLKIIITGNENKTNYVKNNATVLDFKNVNQTDAALIDTTTINSTVNYVTEASVINVINTKLNSNYSTSVNNSTDITSDLNNLERVYVNTTKTLMTESPTISVNNFLNITNNTFNRTYLMSVNTTQAPKSELSVINVTNSFDTIPSKTNIQVDIETTETLEQAKPTAAANGTKIEITTETTPTKITSTYNQTDFGTSTSTTVMHQNTTSTTEITPILQSSDFRKAEVQTGNQNDQKISNFTVIQELSSTSKETSVGTGSTNIPFLTHTVTEVSVPTATNFIISTVGIEVTENRPKDTLPQNYSSFETQTTPNVSKTMSADVGLSASIGLHYISNSTIQDGLLITDSTTNATTDSPSLATQISSNTSTNLTDTISEHFTTESPHFVLLTTATSIGIHDSVSTIQDVLVTTDTAAKTTKDSLSFVTPTSSSTSNILTSDIILENLTTESPNVPHTTITSVGIHANIGTIQAGLVRTDTATNKTKDSFATQTSSTKFSSDVISENFTARFPNVITHDITTAIGIQTRNSTIQDGLVAPDTSVNTMEISPSFITQTSSSIPKNFSSDIILKNRTTGFPNVVSHTTINAIEIQASNSTIQDGLLSTDIAVNTTKSSPSFATQTLLNAPTNFLLDIISKNITTTGFPNVVSRTNMTANGIQGNNSTVQGQLVSNDTVVDTKNNSNSFGKQTISNLSKNTSSLINSENFTTDSSIVVSQTTLTPIILGTGKAQDVFINTDAETTKDSILFETQSSPSLSKSATPVNILNVPQTNIISIGLESTTGIFTSNETDAKTTKDYFAHNTSQTISEVSKNSLIIGKNSTTGYKAVISQTTTVPFELNISNSSIQDGYVSSDIDIATPAADLIVNNAIETTTDKTTAQQQNLSINAITIEVLATDKPVLDTKKLSNIEILVFEPEISTNINAVTSTTPYVTTGNMLRNNSSTNTTPDVIFTINIIDPTQLDSDFNLTNNEQAVTDSILSTVDAMDLTEKLLSFDNQSIAKDFTKNNPKPLIDLSNVPLSNIVQIDNPAPNLESTDNITDTLTVSMAVNRTNVPNADSNLVRNAVTNKIDNILSGSTESMTIGTNLYATPMTTMISENSSKFIERIVTAAIDNKDAINTNNTTKTQVTMIYTTAADNSFLETTTRANELETKFVGNAKENNAEINLVNNEKIALESTKAVSTSKPHLNSTVNDNAEVSEVPNENIISSTTEYNTQQKIGINYLIENKSSSSTTSNLNESQNQTPLENTSNQFLTSEYISSIYLTTGVSDQTDKPTSKYYSQNPDGDHGNSIDKASTQQVVAVVQDNVTPNPIQMDIRNNPIETSTTVNAPINYTREVIKRTVKQSSEVTDSQTVNKDFVGMSTASVVTHNNPLWATTLNSSEFETYTEKATGIISIKAIQTSANTTSEPIEINVARPGITKSIVIKNPPVSLTDEFHTKETKNHSTAFGYKTTTNAPLVPLEITTVYNKDPQYTSFPKLSADPSNMTESATQLILSPNTSLTMNDGNNVQTNQSVPSDDKEIETKLINIRNKTTTLDSLFSGPMEIRVTTAGTTKLDVYEPEFPTIPIGIQSTESTIYQIPNTSVTTDPSLINQMRGLNNHNVSLQIIQNKTKPLVDSEREPTPVPVAQTIQVPKDIFISTEESGATLDGITVTNSLSTTITKEYGSTTTHSESSDLKLINQVNDKASIRSNNNESSQISSPKATEHTALPIVNSYVHNGSSINNATTNNIGTSITSEPIQLDTSTLMAVTSKSLVVSAPAEIEKTHLIPSSNNAEKTLFSSEITANQNNPKELPINTTVPLVTQTTKKTKINENLITKSLLEKKQINNVQLENSTNRSKINEKATPNNGHVTNMAISDRDVVITEHNTSDILTQSSFGTPSMNLDKQSNRSSISENKKSIAFEPIATEKTKLLFTTQTGNQQLASSIDIDITERAMPKYTTAIDENVYNVHMTNIPIPDRDLVITEHSTSNLLTQKVKNTQPSFGTPSFNLDKQLNNSSTSENKKNIAFETVATEKTNIMFTRQTRNHPLTSSMSVTEQSMPKYTTAIDDKVYTNSATPTPTYQTSIDSTKAIFTPMYVTETSTATTIKYTTKTKSVTPMHTSYDVKKFIPNTDDQIVTIQPIATILTTEQTTKATVSMKTNNALKNSTKVSHFDCLNLMRGRYADTEDCRKFYICSGRRQPIVGLCPGNTVFSEVKSQCTKNLSHCIRHNQFKCVTEGRFSDFIRQNVYYICVRNRAQAFIRFKFQCQIGYYLNKVSVRCERNVETSNQSISNISKSTVEKKSKEVSKSKSSKNDDFECEKEGKFADPDNCRKYYVCTRSNRSEEFRRRKKKCDSDEIFHKDKKRCVDSESYECS